MKKVYVARDSGARKVETANQCSISLTWSHHSAKSCLTLMGRANITIPWVGGPTQHFSRHSDFLGCCLPRSPDCAIITSILYQTFLMMCFCEVSLRHSIIRYLFFLFPGRSAVLRGLTLLLPVWAPSRTSLHKGPEAQGPRASRPQDPRAPRPQRARTPGADEGHWCETVVLSCRISCI